MTAPTEPVMPRMVCPRCEGDANDPIASVEPSGFPAPCLTCHGTGSLPVTLTDASAAVFAIGQMAIHAELQENRAVQLVGRYGSGAIADQARATLRDALRSYLATSPGEPT